MRILVDTENAVRLLLNEDGGADVHSAIETCHHHDVPVFFYAGDFQSIRTELERQVGTDVAADLLGKQLRQIGWWSALSCDFEPPHDLGLHQSPRLRAVQRMGEQALLLTNDKQGYGDDERTVSPEQLIARLNAEENATDTITFVDLGRQLDQMRGEIEGAIHRVVNATAFINGSDVSRLEEELSAFVGVEHALCCSSGTDALMIAMMALDVRPGDEIIVPDFTYIATAETVALLGAVPVFADVNVHTYNIDPASVESLISPRTVGIIPVSLYGQPADMDKINQIGANHGLWVMEDAAQSFGATYKGRNSCALTHAAGTSFFPAKPLGCYGDGGAIFTNDDGLAARMRLILNHGQRARYDHAVIGLNGRLDTLQAAVLRTKLARFPEEIEKRQTVAKWYSQGLSDLADRIALPIVLDHNTSVWAQYTIRVTERDQLRSKLAQSGIPTSVHYPIPLHAQDALAPYAGSTDDTPVSTQVSAEVLSLPMHPFLRKSEVERITASIRAAVSE